MVYAVATALCFCFLAVTFVYAGPQDDSGVEAYIPRSLHHTSLIVREDRTMKVLRLSRLTDIQKSMMTIHADIENIC